MNCDCNNKTSSRRLPGWLKQPFPQESTFNLLRSLKEFSLHTVCEEAACPNLTDCFSRGELTFMILGRTCTRSCSFCTVEKGSGLIVPEEPADNLSRLARSLGLKYVVITSVTRDDLADGGAAHFAACVRALCKQDNDIRVEVLIPDFQGDLAAIKTVVESGPAVIAHNIETVPRLYPVLRPQADYQRSLSVLCQAKELSPSVLTKSSIMLGMGEREEELVRVMQDLRRHSCDILVLGQYLAPSPRHYPVQEFVLPEKFMEYRKTALSLGFKAAQSFPKARSSYCAAQAFNEAIKNA